MLSSQALGIRPPRLIVGAAAATLVLAGPSVGVAVASEQPDEAAVLVEDSASILDDVAAWQDIGASREELGGRIVVLTVTDQRLPDRQPVADYSYLDCEGGLGDPDPYGMGGDDPFGSEEDDLFGDEEDCAWDPPSAEEYQNEYDRRVEEYLENRGETEYTDARGRLDDDVALITLTSPSDATVLLGDGVPHVTDEQRRDLAEDLVPASYQIGGEVSGWDNAARTGVDALADEMSGGPETRTRIGLFVVLGIMITAGVVAGVVMVRRNRRPDAQETANAIRRWADLRDEALGRMAFSVHQDADADHALLTAALGADGRITPAALGEDRTALRAALDPASHGRVKARLAYYHRPDGWERTWTSVRFRLAGRAVADAERNHTLLPSGAPDDVRAEAKRIADEASTRLTQIDADVREERMSVSEGELALADLGETTASRLAAHREDHNIGAWGSAAITGRAVARTWHPPESGTS